MRKITAGLAAFMISGFIHGKEIPIVKILVNGYTQDTTYEIKYFDDTRILCTAPETNGNGVSNGVKSEHWTYLSCIFNVQI